MELTFVVTVKNMPHNSRDYVYMDVHFSLTLSHSMKTLWPTICPRSFIQRTIQQLYLQQSMYRLTELLMVVVVY